MGLGVKDIWGPGDEGGQVIGSLGSIWMPRYDGQRGSWGTVTGVVLGYRG